MLTHVWLAVFVFTYPKFIQAATFAQDMRSYDYESILWAVMTGLLGGFARTLVSLATDKVLIKSVWREAGKDAIVSIIAGAAALIAIEALRAVYWTSLPGPLRFAIILFAGASRAAFFGILNNAVTRVLDAWITRLIGKFQAEKLESDFPKPKTEVSYSQNITETASGFVPMDPTKPKVAAAPPATQ